MPHQVKALRQAHEAWVRENLPERGRNRVGWKVLVLQGAHQIEVPAAYTALAPDHEDGEASVLTVKPDGSWVENIAMLTEGARRVLAANDDAFTTRIAVFPLAPVSACIGLGYLLTNRPWTRAYQFHRDDRSWAWRPSLPEAVMPTVLSWPEFAEGAEGDIAICFDLSARVPDTSLRGPTRGFAGVVRLGVPAPSTGWLQTDSQLTGLGVLARESFERLATEFPAASRWHIFYAGPAPGAVVVGQQLNPTMTPPVQLYEFQRGAVPEHSPSVVLQSGRLQSAVESGATTPPAAAATSAPEPTPRTGR